MAKMIARCICGAAVGLFSLGAAAQDWPQWRGPARTGAVATTRAIGASAPSVRLALRWRSGSLQEGAAGGRGSPVVANGRVYLLVTPRWGAALTTRTIDAKVLDQLRKKLADAPRERLDALHSVLDNPFADEPALIAWLKDKGFRDTERAAVLGIVPRLRDEPRSILACFDATTGNTVWKKEHPATALHGWGVSSTPAVAGGVCVAMQADGMLRCFDARSGQQRWEARVGGGKADRGGHSGSPLIVDDLVVVQANPLTAVELATGRIRWTHKQVVATSSSPVLWRHGGTDYVICNGYSDKAAGTHAISCHRLSDGEFRWRVPGSEYATPAVEADTLVALSGREGKGIVAYRLQPDVARELMSVDIAIGSSSPIIRGDRAYCLTRSALVALDLAAPKVLWTHNLSADGIASPLLTGDWLIFHGGRTLYMASVAGDAFKLLAKPRVDTILDCTSPAFADNRLYVREGNGLACYDISAP